MNQMSRGDLEDFTREMSSDITATFMKFMVALAAKGEGMTMNEVEDVLDLLQELRNSTDDLIGKAEEMKTMVGRLVTFKKEVKNLQEKLQKAAVQEYGFEQDEVVKWTSK